MKKIKFFAVLLILILTLSIVVYGQDNTQEGTVVISYARAVELANSTLQDMDDILYEMRELQDELRADLRRLERGDWRSETMHALFEELGQLEIQLFFALQGQLELQNNIQLSMQDVLAGFANPEDASLLHISLQSAIAGIMAAQGAGGNMAMMQNRIADIFEEIMRLQDGTQVREMADAIRGALQEMDDQMAVMRINHQQSQLVVENLLRGLIITVVELEATIEDTKANLVLTEENLRQVRIQHGFGLVSNNDLRTAQRTLTLEQMGLTRQQTSLYNARNNLNYLLGQPLLQHTKIEFNRVLPEISEDLAAHINEIIPTTPTIRLIQMDVDREYAAMRAYRGSNREKRDALRETYENAIQRRNQAKLTMEANLRRAYNELSNLINQKEAHLLELYRTKQTLEVAETNLGLGRITRHEVAQAQQAMSRAKQTIESTLNQMWTLAFRLDNPSLLN